MRKQRLGCLTPIGLLAGLITLFLIFGVSIVQGGTLFSPGKLSAANGSALGGVTSHEQIGGRCNICHVAPWSSESMTGRCLECHSQVQTDLTDPTTLHGSLVMNPNQVECRSCHTEHHGPQAMLTRLDVKNFPHDVTGFSLLAHQSHLDGDPFACRDCHGNNLTRLQPVVCADCHERLGKTYMADHSIAFGSNCLECHDGIDTYGSKFQHDRTQFPLTGSHAEVACQDCHSGSMTIQQLQNTPQDCVACHRDDDPHGGQLGNDCAECHTPEGWKPASFDHMARTGYILVGEHQQAECSQCHQNNTYPGTPSDCQSCHQADDPHSGQLGMDCAQCHTPEGWKPANFNHQDKSGFALVGEHQQVACKQCHPNNSFSDTPADCLACHQKDDAHSGTYGTDCATCHTPQGWKPATFDHNRSNFPLIGKHINVACTACHQKAIFRGTPKNCAACHAKDDTHKGQLGNDCAACHAPTGWKPATFDHNKSGFLLTGAHQAVNCQGCHGNGSYRGTPTACVACHSKDDRHNGQFGADCSACHTTTRWRDVTFNHANTSFPLTGAHSNTACTQCHANGRYKGTSTLCSACHQDPAIHAGLFGADCSACHNTSNWRPASYNRPHNFPMGHGDAGSCRDCHPSSLGAWTCYTCHNQGEIANKHNGEGIGDFSDCLRCHANGQKEEGGGGGEGGEDGSGGEGGGD